MRESATGAMTAAKTMGLLLALALCAAAGAAAKDAGVDEPVGLEVARTLKKETLAAVALHVTDFRPVELPEVPRRLQEFIVEGTVTECFKGPLRAREPVVYYAVTEGRIDSFGKDHIIFLRKGSERKDRWVPVVGTFDPTPEMKAALHKLFGHACRK
jgi:hypothetical protein